MLRDHDPRNRVLLLEAGPRDTNPFIHIPAGASPDLLTLTRADPQGRECWRRQTIVEEPVPGLGGRRMPFPSGKVT